MSQTFSSSSITVLATGVSITTSAVSASATIPSVSGGNAEKPRYIRIAASAAACVRISKGATTAVTTDMQVQPGDAVILHVPSGYDTVAAIQLSAAGVVQVSPMENM